MVVDDLVWSYVSMPRRAPRRFHLLSIGPILAAPSFSVVWDHNLFGNDISLLPASLNQYGAKRSQDQGCTSRSVSATPSALSWERGGPVVIIQVLGQGLYLSPAAIQTCLWQSGFICLRVLAAPDRATAIKT